MTMDIDPIGPTRRELLRGALLALPLLAVPGVSAAAGMDVRQFGARGDGRTDDTLAFQRAVDALGSGGILDVPAGTYMIDPLRSVRLRSGMQLRLARGAQLRAIPNAAPRAYVLTLERVSDVRISGGAIVGDRSGHLGNSGEWGHGIALRGASRVTIADIRISDCWGDGISIGSSAGPGGRVQSSDIEISGVSCIGNRRQGLTVGGSRRVRVHDSEFSNTGGTPPAAGIDVEPDVSVAQDVRIERCVMRGNRGPGIQLWKRALDVAIVDCTIEGNRNAGVLAVAADGVRIEGNRIAGNGGGVVLRKGATRIRLAGNVFRGRGGGNALGGNLRVEDATDVVIGAGNRVD